MNNTFDITVLSETLLLVDFDFVLNGCHSTNSLKKQIKITVKLFLLITINNFKIKIVIQNLITECDCIELIFDYRGKSLGIVGLFRSHNRL